MAALAGVAAAALGLAGVFAPLDRIAYDQAATRLPAPAGPSPVVIVAVDEPSFAEIGLPWPWPRSLHARLIESLRAAGAASIAVDILFADPSDPAEDAALAAALGPDVTLACDEARIETAQGVLTQQVTPAPVFAGQGARCGEVGLPLDPDGALRALPTGPDAFAAQALAGAPTPPAGALIDVSRAPGAMARVSVYQALDAARMLPPDLLRGRVALVGFDLRAGPDATEAGPDRFRTAWTTRGAGLASGVEMHARAIETLARGRWTVPAPGWATALAAMAAAAAAVALARRVPPPAGAAAAAGVALAAAAACAAGLAGGVWLVPAAPAFAALVAGLGHAGLDHARERLARRRILRAFERYLAPEMVRRLAEDPAALRLGGERRTTTLMFCDLRGFTTLTERMKDRPEALTGILNRALTEIADAVLESGGMVDKYIGDCVMGVWNAPLDQPDHAARAVAAALEAARRMDRLSARIDAEARAAGLPPIGLACGIGIESGDCVVGNMGSDRRFDYTALGDPVNLAARLEGLTKRYGATVLVGEGAAALAAEAAEAPALVELDLIAVKGRAAPTRIHVPAALWPAAGATTLQAEALRLYRGRDWSGAAERWRRLAALEPAAADYAAAMIRQAEAFRAAPPPPDWDGSVAADSK
ncbi:adenylate/guanylate cyclase domain-containing protein [Albimonas sp. CAU 1670]|uniref:adenylate/guanylate cyclase domain-containing protein n=1 Tax=Albimonas sp. CAU 1670 TaxID=3032599 RepID=UPI0023DB2B41|nr:adenylate/guanylate cyclase domain-containing protein [Albimonas sp. CAU 1670]MDF2235324.1 adenylate/guanylate cyclase domain-containing protein [Albimonas sp. CAU 1670]